jgi:hypothetical protein
MLSEEDSIRLINSQEALVVFAGCSVQKEENTISVHEKTTKWLQKFPNLILANYCFYPQFPGVGDDPEFNSAPIEPDEDCIIKTIDHHSQYEGVHAFDLSTYYVTHLYVSSIEEILKGKKDFSSGNALPNSSFFLPKEENCFI